MSEQKRYALVLTNKKYGSTVSSSSYQPLSQRSICCRSRKCIRGHIPMHEILPFFICIFIPSHLSLLGLQTKTRRRSNSSTFFSFKSHNLETSMVNVFVHVIRKRSKKYLTQKVVRFGSPGWIPMIQPPFYSSCCSTI